MPAPVRRFTSSVAPPYERGREFGAAHAAAVATTVTAYRRLFGAGVDLDRLGALALSRVDAWAPDLAAEITGIAHGAGLPVAHVAAVNARTELLAVADVPAGLQGPADVPAHPDECSAVVDLGRTTGAPVAAQNWDWYVDLADNWLEWTIPFPDGRRVTTMTEYGLVGKIGVNDRGVGVLFTMLRHDDDGRDVGVPVHVVARRVLDDARDAEHAVALCASARVSASTALTIVSPTGAVCVELWPGGPGRVDPDEAGQLLHTNHFRAAPAQAGDQAVARGSETHTRYEVIRRHLAGRAGALTPADVDGALGDHDAGVCAHPDPATPARQRYATLATVRVDVVAATLDVRAGPPCGR
jgi:isopenicillin-N N-acyltransferase-like protein